MLDYVGHYTHRVAISNHRLLDIEAGNVRFRWKDYRDGHANKTMYEALTGRSLHRCPRCQHRRMRIVEALAPTASSGPLFDPS